MWNRVNDFVYPHFLILSLFLLFLSISYWIWNRINVFAYSHSIIQLIPSFFLHFYIQYWNQLTFLIIHIFSFCRSHIEYEIESMILLIHILVFGYFFLLVVNVIFNMKLNRWLRLFTFYHSVDSFFLSSFLYSILKSANISAYLHSLILSFAFRFCRSHIEYEIESMISLIRILSFSSFFLLSVNLIFNTKLDELFCLFKNYHCVSFFAFLSMLYSILNWINYFADSHFIIRWIPSFFLHSYIHYWN